jgi:hypothetical protein
VIINFDNTIESTEELLSKISEKAIYEYYLRHDIKDGQLYACPFHEDSSPSLGFKLMPSTVLIHRCFGCGERGNAINFVSKLLGLSYWDTVKRIHSDMVTNNTNYSKLDISMQTTSFTKENNTRIFPVFQNFNIVDFNYWNQYSIPLSLLQKYDINACKQVFIKTRENKLVLFAEYSKKNPVYCYTIDNTYKIYKPLNPTKLGKWLSTTKAEDIQGMKQLPTRGEMLIITSSMKDLLVLKVLGYNAIALGGEGNRIPAKILDYLHASFDKILVFYDNDLAGINYGRKLASEIDSEYFYIPEIYKEKDISDFTSIHGLEQTRCLMGELINNGRRNPEEVYTS